MKIFLDKDEVLVDFVGAALKIHGRTFAEVEPNWTPGTWGMYEPLGLTPEEFWKPIAEAGKDFWTGLEAKPWIYSLLALVRKHALSGWWIVSAPSREDSSRIGKIEWMERFFGAGFARYHLRSDKEALAEPGAVLIDDREETVEKFRAAGGKGIVFPAYHNSLHALRETPLAYVREQLEALTL